MEDVYADLKQYFRQVDTVTVCDGKGAQGIKYAGKMFAMFYKGDLVLKLDPQRVSELIKSGKAIAHDPGTGKPMKNRVLVPASKSKTWIGMTKESLEYAGKS